MFKRLKKISEDVIHQNPWWVYKHERYEKPNGEAGDYWYGETNGVAVVIPKLSDGRIALTLQYRYLEDKQSIEFPGGGLDEGADALETAKKELLEETGYIADEYIKIGVFQSANGLLRETVHVFIANVIEQTEQRLDSTEQIEVIYRHPDELEEMIHKNEIWDGQTMAAWSLATNYF